MKKSLICFLLLGIFLFSSQIGHAYSEKTESCIDRINGLILQKFPAELKDLILTVDTVDQEIADFCLANDTDDDYSDLTEIAKAGQDGVDNFFVDTLYGKYMTVSSISLMFVYDFYGLESAANIQEYVDDEFVADSKQEWGSQLEYALSEGFTYFQDYLDAVDRIYQNYLDFKDLVQEGLDNNYICQDGLYTGIGKPNCVCLDGYSWNTAKTACIEETNEVEEIEIDLDPTPIETVDAEDADNDDSLVEIENPFSDLFKLHKNFDAILYLKEKGIINGYPDGTFKPEKTVNRAELLKIIVEGQGFTPTSSEYNNCFPDVDDTEWYAPYVCYAESTGWVNGYPDGTFKPSQTVNKVEALKMLLNSQDIEISQTVSKKPFDDVNTTDWFAPFVTKAKELEILEETGVTFNPSAGMTRGGICENLYRLLTY